MSAVEIGLKHLLQIETLTHRLIKHQKKQEKSKEEKKSENKFWICFLLHFYSYDNDNDNETN